MTTATKHKQNVRSQLTRISNKQLTLCQHCGDVHYKGVWYAPYSQFALLITKTKQPAFYTTCHTCKMQRAGQYEGVLYIKNIPSVLDSQVMALVLHEVEQDYLENPQHRILEFSEMLDGHKITANSGQMIKRIAQTVQVAFGSCQLHTVNQTDSHPLCIAHITFGPTNYLD